MSTAYMPLFTGDYIKDARDLSQGQHGAYILLLMYAWDHDGKLPAADKSCFKIAQAENFKGRENVLLVRARFFTLSEDGFYHNDRIDKELVKLREKTEKRSSAAHKRWDKKDANAYAMHMQSESESESVKEKDKPPVSPKGESEGKFILPEWVDKNSWKEYEGMRRGLKKPMTDKARELAIGKLEKLKAQGYDPKAVLEQSVFNSWQGLFALKDEGNQAKGPPGKAKTREERTMQNAKELFDEIDRREGVY